MFRFTAISLLILGSTALPARAADGDATLPSTNRVIITAPDADARRPLALPVLYFSLAGLQAYDVYSTHQGLSQGAQELNPFMKGMTSNSTGMIVTKALTTATTIAIAERLWHTNKKAAIITMLAANTVMAIVAANNARILHTTR